MTGVRAVLGWLVALLLFVAPSAHAYSYVVANYCATYTVDYDDGTTGDYFTGSSYGARGALIRFIDETDVFAPNQDYYLDESGSTPGCRDITILNHSYTVKLLRHAFVAGNDLIVYDDTTSPAVYATTMATGHVPVDTGDYPWTIGPSESINMLAAATWAVLRYSGGVTGETFSFYTEADSGGGTSYDDTTGNLYFQSSLRNRKFVITHEFGHALGDAANNFQGNAENYNADLDGCNQQGHADSYTQNGTHYMNSKEYQSAAAIEGFAHFYSAVAFNSDEQYAPCIVEKHYTPDWDSSGTVDLGESDTFSCEGSPDADVDYNDYLGDFCIMSGYSDNRGTEYDWLRALWDLTTDEQVSVYTIFQIWDQANPHNWNAAGHLNNDNDNPEERMHDAAYSVGSSSLQSKYDSAASYNGTTR